MTYKPVEYVADPGEWRDIRHNPCRRNVPYTNFNGLEVRLSLIRAPNYDPKTRTTMREPEDVYKLLVKSLDAEPVEQILSVVVNSQLQVLGVYIASRGSEEEAEVQPLDLLRPVIAAGASRLFIVHNHPSDTPDPSSQDFAMTADVIRVADELGIEVLDHIIVGVGSYHSMADSGNWEKVEKVIDDENTRWAESVLFG